jgi:hypothetical protein
MKNLRTGWNQEFACYHSVQILLYFGLEYRTITVLAAVLGLKIDLSH